MLHQSSPGGVWAVGGLVWAVRGQPQPCPVCTLPTPNGCPWTVHTVAVHGEIHGLSTRSPATELGEPYPQILPKSQIIQHLHTDPAGTHRIRSEGLRTPSTLSDAPEADLSFAPGTHQGRLQVARLLPSLWLGQCFFFCVCSQYFYLDI